MYFFPIETTWKAFEVNCQDNHYKRREGGRLCPSTHTLGFSGKECEWSLRELAYLSNRALRVRNESRDTFQ